MAGCKRRHINQYFVPVLAITSLKQEWKINSIPNSQKNYQFNNKGIVLINIIREFYGNI